MVRAAKSLQQIEPFPHLWACVCLNMHSERPSRGGRAQPSRFRKRHLIKLRGQPDGGSACPFKAASTGCAPGLSQGPQGPWLDHRATAPPARVPACEFPVENIVMLYSSFLLADVDSLYDKTTLQSLFWADFALRGSW